MKKSKERKLLKRTILYIEAKRTNYILNTKDKDMIRNLQNRQYTEILVYLNMLLKETIEGEFYAIY